jgi:formylglycine-generating enzyme required for sulfatase activity
MDQIVRRILLFDRFALDLARGCLRVGDQDVELRPKTFAVLCYLADNAGRLVTKQELHDAVWADVAVSDDSLVQCIRELRVKLGDDDHRLIKTVSRRGYLLEAAVSEAPAQGLANGSPTLAPGEVRREVPRASQPMRRTPRVALRAWLAVAAALFVAGVWLAAYQPSWPISAAISKHLSENTVASPPRGVAFKDCVECPEMVALAAGEFMMGSPASESGHEDVEGPPRRVRITNRFAVGKFEVTVDQFSSFVTETGMAVSELCRELVGVDHSNPTWDLEEASFRHPGFTIVGSQPAVCVSWLEAQGYATWLQRRTGRPYRLATEAEWEYAARAGTQTSYSFGDDETMLCAYAKFADLGSRYAWRDACRSDMVAYGPAPVGSLKPNPWGLFDMHGNAWEWVQDCWTPNASETPTDGSAFTRPNGCEEGVIRGGSFASGSRRVRSAMRAPSPVAAHNYNTGFRVALSLGSP